MCGFNSPDYNSTNLNHFCPLQVPVFKCILTFIFAHNLPVWLFVLNETLLSQWHSSWKCCTFWSMQSTFLPAIVLWHKMNLAFWALRWIESLHLHSYAAQHNIPWLMMIVNYVIWRWCFQIPIVIILHSTIYNSNVAIWTM